MADEGSFCWPIFLDNIKSQKNVFRIITTTDAFQCLNFNFVFTHCGVLIYDFIQLGFMSFCYEKSKSPTLDSPSPHHCIKNT